MDGVRDSTAAPATVSQKTQNFLSKRLRRQNRGATPVEEPIVTPKIAEVVSIVLPKEPVPTTKAGKKNQKLTVIVPTTDPTQLPEKAPSPLPKKAQAEASSPKSDGDCICALLTPKSVAHLESPKGENSEDDAISNACRFVAGLVGMAPGHGSIEPNGADLTFNSESEENGSLSLPLTPTGEFDERIKILPSEDDQSLTEIAQAVQEVAQRSPPSTPTHVEMEASESSILSSPVVSEGEESPSTSTALIVYEAAKATLSITPKASTQAETPRRLSIDLREKTAPAGLSRMPSKSLEQKGVNMSTVSTVTESTTSTAAVMSSANSPRASQAIQTQAQQVQTAAQEVVREARTTVLTHPLLLKLREKQTAALTKADATDLDKALDCQELYTGVVDQLNTLTTFLGTVGSFKEQLILNAGAVGEKGYTCTADDKSAFETAGKTYEATSKKLVNLREAILKNIAILDQRINENASKIDARSLNLAEMQLKMGVDTKDYLPVEATWENIRELWINQKSALIKGVDSLNSLNVEITTTLKSYQAIVDPKNETMLAYLAKPVTVPAAWVRSLWTGPSNTTYSITGASAV